MKTKSYADSCKTDFWSAVFHEEAGYLIRELNDCSRLLSVGCGPAEIEGRLSGHGFEVTGLDVSQEALSEAPDGVRAIIGSAEQMPFSETSFDGVTYVASLQFISDYEKALAETARVLRPNGVLLSMLLNPESKFFMNRAETPDSYVNKIRHTVLTDIRRAISRHFAIQKAEYFLGIEGEELFDSDDPNYASLYCIKGIKE